MKSRSMYDSGRTYPRGGEKKPTALLQGIHFFKIIDILDNLFLF